MSPTLLLYGVLCFVSGINAITVSIDRADIKIPLPTRTSMIANGWRPLTTGKGYEETIGTNVSPSSFLEKNAPLHPVIGKLQEKSKPRQEYIPPTILGSFSSILREPPQNHIHLNTKHLASETREYTFLIPPPKDVYRFELDHQRKAILRDNSLYLRQPQFVPHHHHHQHQHQHQHHPSDLVQRPSTTYYTNNKGYQSPTNLQPPRNQAPKQFESLKVHGSTKNNYYHHPMGLTNYKSTYERDPSFLVHESHEVSYVTPSALYSNYNFRPSLPYETLIPPEYTSSTSSTTTSSTTSTPPIKYQFQGKNEATTDVLPSSPGTYYVSERQQEPLPTSAASVWSTGKIQKYTPDINEVLPRVHPAHKFVHHHHHRPTPGVVFVHQPPPEQTYRPEYETPESVSLKHFNEQQYYVQQQLIERDRQRLAEQERKQQILIEKQQEEELKRRQEEVEKLLSKEEEMQRPPYRIQLEYDIPRVTSESTTQEQPKQPQISRPSFVELEQRPRNQNRRRKPTTTLVYDTRTEYIPTVLPETFPPITVVEETSEPSTTTTTTTTVKPKPRRPGVVRRRRPSTTSTIETPVTEDIRPNIRKKSGQRIRVNHGEPYEAEIVTEIIQTDIPDYFKLPETTIPPTEINKLYQEVTDINLEDLFGNTEGNYIASETTTTRTSPSTTASTTTTSTTTTTTTTTTPAYEPSSLSTPVTAPSRSHKVRPMRYGNATRPRFSIKDYKSRLDYKNKSTTTSTEASTQALKQRLTNSKTEQGTTGRYKYVSRMNYRTTTPSSDFEETNGEENYPSTSERSKGLPKRKPLYGSGYRSRVGNFSRSSTNDTDKPARPENVFSSTIKRRPLMKSRLQIQKEIKREELSTEMAAEETSFYSIPPTTESVPLVSSISNEILTAFNTTEGGEILKEEPLKKKNEPTMALVNEDFISKVVNVEKPEENDRENVENEDELFVKASQSVADLTSSASALYNKPGLFKAVSDNRPVKQFQIPNDEPTLPIEAFFQELTKKD